MAFLKVWLHIVWGTKDRRPYLMKDIRKRVLDHMLENAKAKGIYISCIGGYVDHVHCLAALDSEMSIAKTVQLLKGESSYWINKNKITEVAFEWADEYYVRSVGESELSTVMVYIGRQEEHHAQKTFGEECEEFSGEKKVAKGESPDLNIRR